MTSGHNFRPYSQHTRVRHPLHKGIILDRIGCVLDKEGHHRQLFLGFFDEAIHIFWCVSIA